MTTLIPAQIDLDYQFNDSAEIVEIANKGSSTALNKENAGQEGNDRRFVEID